MKQNFLTKKIPTFLAWSMTHISWLTMAFSPVAMGKEAEQKNTLYYKQFIQDLGLNQKMTVGEFWKKVKADLPGFVYYEIEELVKSNPNALMPIFDVKSSKGSDGNEVPVISFTENGKSHNVQIFGQKDKFIKFDNTTMNQASAENPATLFQKLIDNDKKLKNEYQQQLKKYRAPSSASKGWSNFKFSDINAKMWKAMTIEQRATFLIQMRLMYLDARKVNTNGKANQETSSFKILDQLYNILVQSAEAQTKSTTSSTKKVTTLAGKTITVSNFAESCVVAGYIGKYVPQINNVNGQKRQGCSVDVAIGTYQDKKGYDYVIAANDVCRNAFGVNNGVSCNPVIYGYPNAKPLCIDKRSQNFQIATHWDGPCDKASRLTSDNVADLSGKDYSKISPREKQIEAIKTDQAKENFKLTKDFISGVLESKDPAMLKLLQDGVWSQALEDEIKRIGQHFDDEIESAIKTCEKDITGKHEINQKKACDQLHGRKLFVDEIIKKLVKDAPTPPVPDVVKCPENSKESTTEKGKCVCTFVDDSGSKTTFDPKGTKDLPEGLPDVCVKGQDPLPPPPKPVAKCDQYPPLTVGVELNDDCTCKNTEGSAGNFPKEDQPGMFSKLFNTQKNKDFKATATQNRIHSCKFGPNWWAVGGIALGIGALTALLFAKRKTKEVYVDRVVTNEVIKEVVKEVPVDREVIKEVIKVVEKPVCAKKCTYQIGSETREVLPNPETCICILPSEGGIQSGPSDSGGVGSGQ